MMSKTVRCVFTAMLLLLLASCENADRRLNVERWGDLKSVVMQGEDQGRVSLNEIEGRSGSYGIGALAGLAGEIIVLDGHVWHAQGAPGGGIITSDQVGADLQAALLVLAEVPDWNESVLTDGVTWAALEMEIGKAVHAADLDPSEPVPFLIEGELENLELHVLNGSCPYRHEEGSTPPVRLALDQAVGTLVGFYFEGEPGILTHRGQYLHLHVLTAGEESMAGHVDAVSLASGCKFSLPWAR